MFSVARRKMRGPRCSEAFRWSGSIQLPPTACRLSVLDETRRHLLWKSRTREWMEMNYLLGGFVERHLPSLSMQELQQLDRLLLRKEEPVVMLGGCVHCQLQDYEIFPWLSGRAPVPSDLPEKEVMILLLRYINSDHPSLKALHPSVE
ncbi:unnamed protein product [Effrenium voratum]|uniref:Succinate dehydrogenase assembly factor 2, mitochondrial n=1 Tax=Effrenium voratum TaxID=2562239 RepID=A0AA36J6W1_9DINO|nr:unnamed protein product [Effrenium voratum]CAJ1437607.1 unnamed protein product [Effrenium voratum]